MGFSRRTFIAGLMLATVHASTLQAADPQIINIYVKDMHCATCAKKISSKLSAVPGVAQVKTNVAKGLATVTVEKNKQVSARAVWEAVEAASFAPIRVATASGTFEKKPTR